MKLREYCKCGGQLTGRASPDKAAVEAQQIFWGIHSGEGHGAVEPSKCYSARRKAETNVGIPIEDYCDLED